MDYAQLRLNYRDLPLNRRAEEWLMEGTNPYVVVSMRDLHYSSKQDIKVGDVVRFGAYRLRMVDERKGYPSVLFVHENWLGLPRLYGQKLGRLGADIYHRFIITLHIWGLAECTNYVPSWRDIKIIRWIMKQGKNDAT